MLLRSTLHVTFFTSFFGLAGFIACSSGSTHDTLAPVCTADCGSLVSSGGGGGGSSGGTGDGAVGDIIGDTLDGAPAAVTIAGNITVPVGLASNPATANIDSTTVYTVSAASLLVDGGTTTTLTSGGVYSLANVEVTTLPTWFEVSNGTAPVTFVGMEIPNTNTSLAGIDFPVYSQAIVQATASGAGVLYDNTKATIVIRVVTSSTGTAVAGATASSQTSGTGPYYDNGDNVNVTAKSTGTNGTIVFLGVTPNAGLSGFAVNVAIPAVGANAAGTATVGLVASAGAVTYYVLTVPG
jgi:hypothetical protein